MPRIVGMELRTSAFAAFGISDPMEKARLTLTLGASPSQYAVDTAKTFTAPCSPGRPDRPTLVTPQSVARRSPYTAVGHAALIHSIAHIEFNAINLALDAVWRFPGLPADFYLDWLSVAFEEAKHFTMLRNHLQSLGYDYGNFDAHNGLWEMCESTQFDVVARMALVPRTLEARGLDATPIIQAKLRKVGSAAALEAVGLLDIILAEEVGHVAIGNRWYHWLCQRDGIDPQHFYEIAAHKHGAPKPRPPFNLAARRLAGFTESEISALPV